MKVFNKSSKIEFFLLILFIKYRLKNSDNKCSSSGIISEFNGWWSSSFWSWSQLHFIEINRYDLMTFLDKIRRVNNFEDWLIKFCLVMATPRDNPTELSGRQSAELIRDLLDTKHSQSYMLFSLDQYHRGQTSYRKEIFHNRVCLKSFHFFYILFLFRLLIYHYLMKNMLHV